MSPSLTPNSSPGGGGEQPLLKVDGLVTRLNNGARIVDDISFSINHGETFVLLGESGCGKSMTALSLMRLLPGGIHIESGAVQLEGADILALPERAMREVRGGRIAMIFQEPGLSLNPVMTVGDQIAEALELHQKTPPPSVPLDETTSHSTRLQETAAKSLVTPMGEGGLALLPPGEGLGRGKHSIERRCIELLDQVGIPDAARRLHEYPFQLSGGMKQRVMIAMALAGQPVLLVADEPTTALDVTIQAQVLQLLRDTQQKSGMSILLITHDLGVVAQVAHHVAVMYAGHIVEQATREQLFASPAHPYTQKLFAALPGAQRRGQPLAAIPGSVPPLHDIPKGCRFAPRCDHAWALCHEQAPEWTVLGEGRGVRCHLYRELVAGSLLPVAKEKELVAGSLLLVAKNKEQATPSSQLPASGYQLPATSYKLLQAFGLKVYFPIRKGVLQRVVGQVKAVDGVSLEIPQGRTLALVGESGCGKTTLGKALLQLIPPTAGSVQFAGRELIGLKTGELRTQRAAMQMVFQDPYASLNPKMRVAEILEEGMAALNIGGNSIARQEHLDTLLDQAGLARTAKWRYPHEFSGGQRQRIAIARALAVSPKLLICDEPTSALDVSVQAQILNLLKSLQEELNLSYLFISHNLAVVEYLAHEVCVMYLGRIVERGTVNEVLHTPKHPYTQALLSAVPRIDKRGVEVIRLAGELPSPANPPQGCHFAPRCSNASDQCRASYPPATSCSATHIVHCHLLTAG